MVQWLNWKKTGSAAVVHDIFTLILTLGELLLVVKSIACCKKYKLTELSKYFTHDIKGSSQSYGQ